MFSKVFTLFSAQLCPVVDGGQKVSHFGGQEVGYLALPGEGNLQPDS
jgi:hypothetical protein